MESTDIHVPHMYAQNHESMKYNYTARARTKVLKGQGTLQGGTSNTEWHGETGHAWRIKFFTELDEGPGASLQSVD